MYHQVRVAVAVIYNKSRDKVLISRRKKGQHLAGLWEFPGGKIEADENTQSALYREIFEELGIEINKAEPLKTISYQYPDKNVLLDVWSVYEWTGQPKGMENQHIEWTYIKDLDKHDFPDANKFIIKAIKLPALYLISQSDFQEASYLLDTLQSCLQAGVKVFQVRLANRYKFAFNELMVELYNLCQEHETKLILNGTPEEIKKYNIHGVHLKAHNLFKYSERPVDKSYLLGVSCHTEEELERSLQIEADYVFLSPIKKTISHPESQPIGWERFREMCASTNIPVYALGGMSIEDLKLSKNNGAQGIAMISEIWNSNSPEEIIKRSLD